MNKQFTKKAVLAVIVLASILGITASLMHYLVTLPVEMVVAQDIKPGVEWFRDQKALYARYFLITFLHIVPAIALLLLAPLQLMSSIRKRFPALHRLAGWTFVGCAIPVALSGLALGIVMPFGGLAETLVTLLLFAVFSYCLYRGVQHIGLRQIALHRIWMSRMLVIAYTPITMRLVYQIGMVAFDLHPREVFAPSLLVGALINLMLCEWWLYRTAGRFNKPGARAASQLAARNKAIQ